MSLSHRERVVNALNHEDTDRPPIDFGGGPATQIHPDAYEALLNHLGFEPESVEQGLKGSFQALIPSEKVLRHFDIDVRGIGPGGSDSRPNVQLDDMTYRDEWEVVWKKAFDRAPYINVDGPLQKLLGPKPSSLDEFAWPDPSDPGRIRGLRERTEKLRNESDHAIVMNLGNTTFALSQRLRGFAELLEDLILNESYASALMERVTDVVCGIAEATLAEIGDLVECVSSADDMGVQTQPFMSPDLYRRLVKPHHKRLVEAIRRHTDAKVILHSDGAVAPLLADYIDCGIQVLNPVQTNATGMSGEDLNREFGKDLCFWGGIDTQEVLPHGTPEVVAAEVAARRKDLGESGGWVVASVHNIQAEVPPENVVAMFDAARLPRN